MVFGLALGSCFVDFRESVKQDHFTVLVNISSDTAENGGAPRLTMKRLQL